MYLLCHYDGIVAHFNHKMRKESDDDARFVWQWCVDHDRVCVIGEAYGELKSENEAREARYAFLRETAQELGCDRILTAHNMNDNAETVLFNLARGTGSKGLCGIPEVRDNIYRPMLNVSRKEIEKYLEDNNIPYVIDKTNLTDDYSRNLIRHKVIPELEKINPNAVEAIYHMSLLLKSDEDFIEKSEMSDHPAKMSRYIRDNCPRTLSYEQVQSVLNMGEGYKELNLPGITVIKDRGNLYFEKPEISFDVELEEINVNNVLTNDLISCDLIKGNIKIGTRKPGDKYRPLGRNCTKTLKSLFLEANLTQAERNAWPVLRDDEGIIYVYKFGPDERVAASKNKKAIKIKIKEN